MDYLYGHLANGGTVGADGPSIGDVFDGAQHLKPDIASNMMQVLASLYLTVDPAQTPAAGVQNLIAATEAQVKETGADPKLLDNAAESIKKTTGVVLVNVNEVLGALSFPGTTPPQYLHLVVAADKATAKVLAPDGSNLAILYPITSKAEEKPAGIKPMAIVAAAVGAGVGALVAGVPGALIGGIGAGVLVQQVA